MHLNLADLLMPLTAYLVGGISTGYLLVRFLRGIDIRSTGSGSLGARNVGRILGRTGFYLTLIGDICKGTLMVWAAYRLALQPWVVGLTVVAVIAGHIWPVWLQFHGGKGIATSLGAFMALDYTLLLLGTGLLLLFYLPSRHFLLSWGLALLLLPLVTSLLAYPYYISGSLCISAILVLSAHHKNIKAQLFSSK